MNKSKNTTSKDETEIVIEFGAEGGSLEVERTKIEGAFKYRLHYYDGTIMFLNEEDCGGLVIEDKWSDWFPDLAQALASSRWEWWMMSLAKIAPDLKPELRRIIEANPVAKSYIDENPFSFRRLFRKKENEPSIEEIRRIRAEDPTPCRCLWSGDDMELGMTEEDKQAVIDARHEDWDYNGTDGYEPPAAKAILDKYTHRFR
jgi:hypothetical protein